MVGSPSTHPVTAGISSSHSRLGDAHLGELSKPSTAAVAVIEGHLQELCFDTDILLIINSV